MTEDELIEKLTMCMNEELPDRYKPKLEEFKLLVDKDLMRASYAVLDSLFTLEDWNPSSKLTGLIKSYQVVF